MSLIFNNVRSRGIQYGISRLTIVPMRTKYYNNRHRDPKYRRERGWKNWKVELPDFDEIAEEKKISPEESRSLFKEKGIAPPSPWDEREMFTPCTMSLIDAYKPPEGDGKFSKFIASVKAPGAKGVDVFKRIRAVSDIRNYEGEDFEIKQFAKQSIDIYIKAHKALAAKDDENIFSYVTEHCFPVMTAGLKFHTINWQYIGEVEPPEVVQIRSADLVSKGNKYSQITVRLHTKQILAIYDRHGRLVHGSPVDVKDVLEFVVFEKYLANEYGNWRIHDRIRPQESTTLSRTYVVKN